MKVILTVTEVAAVLRVDRRTVITAIKKKKLKGFMVGVQYRVKREDLMKYINLMEV
jgi:excisionase family DNA binding protein